MKTEADCHACSGDRPAPPTARQQTWQSAESKGLRIRTRNDRGTIREWLIGYGRALSAITFSKAAGCHDGFLWPARHRWGWQKTCRLYPSHNTCAACCHPSRLFALDTFYAPPGIHGSMSRTGQERGDPHAPRDSTRCHPSQFRERSLFELRRSFPIQPNNVDGPRWGRRDNEGRDGPG